jgi:hypothetical protein
MRSFKHFTMIAIALASAGLIGGCISTSKEVREPAPVVQVTPPEPASSVVNSPSSTSESSTTSWDHGAVIQRQTTTTNSSGAVQKQTTITWDNPGGQPSQTTVTTTIPDSSTN